MNNFDLRKFINENKTSKEVKEAAPGFQHDCAAHVVHETYGYGVCIEGQHTLVENAEGKHEVTHYDVFFKNGGIVKDIPVNELSIKSMEEHSHGKRKKNEEEVAEESDTVEEDAVATAIGTVGASVVLALIAKVGFDIVLGFLAKKFPEKFAKFNEKYGLKSTEKYLGKDAIGDVGKAKFGEEVAEGTVEDELREERLKKEVEAILGK